MVNNNTGILPQEIRMHDMEKIHSKLRRTDYYDFGHGLTLMNVLFKTEDGKLDRIDTYIGVEGNEFVCGVGPKTSLRRVLYFPTANMFDFNEQTKQPILTLGQSQILCKR